MTCVFLSVTLNGWGHVWEAEMGAGCDKKQSVCECKVFKLWWKDKEFFVKDNVVVYCTHPKQTS